MKLTRTEHVYKNVKYLIYDYGHIVHWQIVDRNKMGQATNVNQAKARAENWINKNV